MKISFYFGLIVLLFLVEQSLQQPDTSYVAEGYFVVDSKALEIYLKENESTDPDEKLQEAMAEAKMDVDYFLTQTNLLLATMKPHGLDIQIRTIKVEFLTNNVFDSESIENGNEINPSGALAEFDSWLDINYVSTEHSYDFAMLLTGFDFKGNYQSFAHGGMVCKETATAVVDYTGTFQVVYGIARSLAHILGSGDSGFASTDVMARFATPANEERWTFSWCSTHDILQNIAKNLDSINANCLTPAKTRPDAEVPSTSPAVYEGKLYNYDSVCRREFQDQDSFMCRSTGLYNGTPKGDNICSEVFCRKPGTNLCFSTYATEGFICDKGKRCKAGRCQADPSQTADGADPNCLLGDVPMLDLVAPDFKGTCKQLLLVYGKRACYHDLIASWCCFSCDCVSSGIEGCEYGDRISDCGDNDIRFCSWTDWNTQCCDTCQSWDGTTFRRRRSAESSGVNIQGKELKIEVVLENVGEKDGQTDGVDRK